MINVVYLYDNELSHVVLQCADVQKIRENLLNELSDLPNMHIGVNLGLLEDEEFLQTLLGRNVTQLSSEEHVSVITIGAKYIYKMYYDFLKWYSGGTASNEYWWGLLS